jgi:hypothetical protein
MLRGVLALQLFVALCLSHAAENTGPFKVGGFGFKTPEGWTRVETPPGGMRAAELKIPGEKDSGQVVFFVFPGGGGGVQANVDRWLGMFQEGRDKINSKVEKVKVGNANVTYVQAEGTYMSGMPGGPKTPMPNYMLQGAIIESDQGNVFVRLTGPNALVKANQDKFKNLVKEAVGK